MKIKFIVSWKCKRCGVFGNLSEEEIDNGDLDIYQEIIEAQHHKLSPNCEAKELYSEARVNKQSNPIEVKLVGPI